jgi:Protein of unknown function (DUF2721)
MPEMSAPLALLSSMITPAVLISASGTLILSTSTRLARVIDRVRVVIGSLQALYSDAAPDHVETRRAHVERQLEMQTRRVRLIQRALTTFYVSLGVFVATTVSIALSAFVPDAAFLPSALGVAGTLSLFYGCVLLIGETRLALRSVDAEMEFALRLRELYEQQRAKAPRG